MEKSQVGRNGSGIIRGIRFPVVALGRHVSAAPLLKKAVQSGEPGQTREEVLEND